MATAEFVKKIESALEELVTLKVVTAIGETRFETTQDNGTERRKLVVEGKSKVIWTSIDLVQGDITTCIDPEFQGEAGKELREFHKGREQQGIAIIRQNIEALRDLVKLLGEAYKSVNERPKEGTPAPKALPAKATG